jgi:hypothetical protein
MPLGVVAIIGSMDMILAEPDRIRNLVGQLIDADLDAKLGEGAHDFGVEIGDRAREESHLPLTTFARRHPQYIVEEIEIKLEGTISERNWRRGQAASRYIKHNVPGMIEPRRLREADLADDLRPAPATRLGSWVALRTSLSHLPSESRSLCDILPAGKVLGMVPRTKQEERFRG